VNSNLTESESLKIYPIISSSYNLTSELLKISSYLNASIWEASFFCICYNYKLSIIMVFLLNSISNFVCICFTLSYGLRSFYAKSLDVLH